MLQRLCALRASEQRIIVAITLKVLITSIQSGKTQTFYDFLSWIFSPRDTLSPFSCPCSPNAAGSVPTRCFQAALRMTSSSLMIAPWGPPGAELQGFGRSLGRISSFGYWDHPGSLRAYPLTLPQAQSLASIRWERLGEALLAHIWPTGKACGAQGQSFPRRAWSTINSWRSLFMKGCAGEQNPGSW